MALLTLHNVSHRYGTHPALHDVNLQLQPGLIGLLGPNGAGKSTLLKIIMGLVKPTAGTGEVLGTDLRASGISRRRLMGYMTEMDALVPGLRGVEFAALAGELCGMPRKDAQRRAHELLTFLGLEEARYRKLEEYSTGMKQRLKLAQALIHDPPLLLLDEPTSGLDAAGREAMLKLLQSLGQEHGKSLLLSTHLLGDVERVCDQVVILFGGRVLRHGQTAELRGQTRDRYRLEATPATRLERYAHELTLEGAAVSVGPGRGDLRVQVPPGWPTRLFFTHAENSAVVLRGLERDDEDLEQTFLRVLQETERQEALGANGTR